MNITSIRREVIDLVKDIFGVEEAQITDSSRFIDDLGGDDIDVTELVMGIENKFGIEIFDEEAEKLTMVGKVIELFIGEEVKKIASDVFRMNKLQSYHTLKGDLEGNEIDIIEFFSKLEEKFKIEIPEEEEKKLLTISDVVKYLAKQIKETREKIIEEIKEFISSNYKIEKGLLTLWSNLSNDLGLDELDCSKIFSHFEKQYNIVLNIQHYNCGKYSVEKLAEEIVEKISEQLYPGK